MREYVSKIGPQGRVLIPAECRRLLGLKEGAPVVLRIDGDELRLFTLKQSLKKAQHLVKKYSKGKSLVGILKQLRERDE